MAFNPTPRPSKIQSLADLYGTVNAIPATGIRSHIINRQGVMAWGLSKNAGAPTYARTNFIKDDWNSEFTPFSRGTFNARALNYARGGLNHDNSTYR